MSEAINSHNDLYYNKGYSDGYKDGYRKALESIDNLIEQSRKPQYIVVPEEKYKEIQNELIREGK